MKGKSKQMRRPSPQEPKARLAAGTFGPSALKALAERATYEGSAQHKDTPSFAGAPQPRAGATHVGATDEAPDCMLCPHKWAGKQDAATDLLRLAIEKGQFSLDGLGENENLPKYVWARDPSDPRIVYKARRLSAPPTGYKAYPLTSSQIARLEVPV